MVSINIARAGVEISWEVGDYVGPVRIKAVNMENGDVGIVKSDNDGKAFLTWPPGSYSDYITVYEDAVPESEDPEATPHEGEAPEPRIIDEGAIFVTVIEE